MATNNERLQMLMAAHYEFVKAAGLPEGARPYSVQSRLEQIEKDIMEELDKSKAAKNDTPPPAPKPWGSDIKNDDDIPF